MNTCFLFLSPIWKCPKNVHFLRRGRRHKTFAFQAFHHNFSLMCCSFSLCRDIEFLLPWITLNCDQMALCCFFPFQILCKRSHCTRQSSGHPLAFFIVPSADLKKKTIHIREISNRKIQRKCSNEINIDEQCTETMLMFHGEKCHHRLNNHLNCPLNDKSLIKFPTINQFQLNFLTLSRRWRGEVL